MRPSQELTGGPDSTNFQAGRDITYDVSATEARQIALDVYNDNYLRLAGVAGDVARDRAERITRDYIETQQSRNPAGLNSMSDPDMLRALYAAQEGFACSGEDDLEAALIDLLVDRAGQVERDLKTQVLNQAIATLPKLTKAQRAATTIAFSARYTRYVGPFTLAAFYKYLIEYLVPFVVDIPDSTADFGYMEYAGLGSVNTFMMAALADAYAEQACGFFSNGFSKEIVHESWTPFLDDPEVFMPCIRDPEKLQIRARSMVEVGELAEAKGIPTLVTYAATGRMLSAEIQADMITHIPSLGTLFEKWGGAGIPSLGQLPTHGRWNCNRSCLSA